ncbi:MAG: hypothetical protein KDN20_22930 [Verrucomicrobiae bacterium]|nr:hypothetical protein [Verrucomicrobiae bacterium]
MNEAKLILLIVATIACPISSIYGQIPDIPDVFPGEEPGWEVVPAKLPRAVGAHSKEGFPAILKEFVTEAGTVDLDRLEKQILRNGLEFHSLTRSPLFSMEKNRNQYQALRKAHAVILVTADYVEKDGAFCGPVWLVELDEQSRLVRYSALHQRFVLYVETQKNRAPQFFPWQIKKEDLSLRTAILRGDLITKVSQFNEYCYDPPIGRDVYWKKDGFPEIGPEFQISETSKKILSLLKKPTDKGFSESRRFISEISFDDWASLPGFKPHCRLLSLEQQANKTEEWYESKLREGVLNYTSGKNSDYARIMHGKGRHRAYLIFENSVEVEKASHHFFLLWLYTSFDKDSKRKPLLTEFAVELRHDANGTVEIVNDPHIPMKNPRAMLAPFLKLPNREFTISDLDSLREICEERVEKSEIFRTQVWPKAKEIVEKFTQK